MKMFLCVVVALSTVWYAPTSKAQFDGHSDSTAVSNLAGGGLEITANHETPKKLVKGMITLTSGTSDPTTFTLDYITYALVSQNAQVPITGQVNNSNVVVRSIGLYDGISGFAPGNIHVDGTNFDIRIPFALTANANGSGSSTIVNSDGFNDGLSYEKDVSHFIGTFSSAQPGLNVSSVITTPEPSSMALLGTCSLVLLRRFRGRRQAYPRF